MKNILFIICIGALFFIVSNLKADFVVAVTKDVNLIKEQTIKAKLENDKEKRFLEGFLSVTRKDEKGYLVNIQWLSLIDKDNKKISVNYFSNLDIEKHILKRNTIILVKGSLPSVFETNTKEKDKKDKSPSTTTNIAQPLNGLSSSVSNPELIVTFDGCEHVYNPSNETISVMQRSYYLSDNGREMVVRNCTKAKGVPASYKACDMVHDYYKGISVSRRQAIFTEQDKGTYSAGGCIPIKTYQHNFVESSCSPIVVNEFFIRRGVVQYSDEDTLETTNLTGCVINPKQGSSNEKQLLKVEYGSCETNHNLDLGYSILFGRYYYENNNEKRIVSDCQLTYLSQLSHKMEFKQWVFFDNEKYANKILSRYILYPENTSEYHLYPDQPIYFTEQEEEVIRYNYIPVRLEERRNSYLNTSGERASGCPGGYISPNSSQPNLLASWIGYKSEECTYWQSGSGGEGTTKKGTKTFYRWQWQQYTLECNAIFKRPDNSEYAYDEWQLEGSSWNNEIISNLSCG